MKYRQEITVEGEDMVLTIRSTVLNRLLGKRRWKGAAKYIYATKEFKDKGHVFVLAVPVAATLDIKGAPGSFDLSGGL